MRRGRRLSWILCDESGLSGLEQRGATAGALAVLDGRRSLKYVVKVPQARARRIDQHRHIAGLVLVGAHQFMRIGNLAPREHVADARIDAAVDDELIGGARLLQMREMRALNAL